MDSGSRCSRVRGRLPAPLPASSPPRLPRRRLIYGPRPPAAVPCGVSARRSRTPRREGAAAACLCSASGRSGPSVLACAESSSGWHGGQPGALQHRLGVQPARLMGMRAGGVSPVTGMLRRAGGQPLAPQHGDDPPRTWHPISGLLLSGLIINPPGAPAVALLPAAGRSSQLRAPNPHGCRKARLLPGSLPGVPAGASVEDVAIRGMPSPVEGLCNPDR